METQNMEQSRNSLNRLNAVVEELAAAVRSQQKSFCQRLDEEKAKAVKEAEKNASLAAELAKVREELDALRNNTENETKILQLQSELENKTNKVGGLQTEVQNLNNALTNRKTQIEELTGKIKSQEVQIQEMQAKITVMEQNSSLSGTKIQEMQQEKEEWMHKCQNAEEQLSELQQTVAQTSDNIDSVVAKLEKVLEENGTSSHND